MAIINLATELGQIGTNDVGQALLRKNKIVVQVKQKTGQALHKENSDSAMFHEAEADLKQYFDYPTKFERAELFSQNKV